MLWHCNITREISYSASTSQDLSFGFCCWPMVVASVKPCDYITLYTEKLDGCTTTTPLCIYYAVYMYIYNIYVHIKLFFLAARQQIARGFTLALTLALNTRRSGAPEHLQAYDLRLLNLIFIKASENDNGDKEG